MQLQWLYYFTTIAELEHYTRAAERLRVSQSNLSHAMRDMERELGTKLFERKGRNVQLTKYGQLFLPYAKKTLNTLEAGIDTLKEYLDPNKGTIMLGGFYSIEAFATDLMIRYCSETNRVGVQFQYSSRGWYNLRKDLLEGKLDLILCTKIDSPQIGSCYIGEHALVALVRSDILLPAERACGWRIFKDKISSPLMPPGRFPSRYEKHLPNGASL